MPSSIQAAQKHRAHSFPFQCIVWLGFIACFLLGANAQDATIAGPFHIEHPTLLNLGFDSDLGGLEVGRPAPHYGPRWLTWQPVYR